MARTRSEIATEVAEREEMLIDLMKNSKGTITLSDLTDATGIRRETLRQHMLRIKDTHKQLKIQTVFDSERRRRSVIYRWVELPLNRTYKNSEGYPDETAEVAIENVDDPKADTVSLAPGEVWSTSESNGTTGMIFVFNALNGAAQCVKLYPDVQTNREIVGPDPFQIGDMIGDVTHITFKPLRYCIRRVSDRNDAKLMEARKRAAQVLGIKCFTPEVIEKEVIKEVPVKDDTEINRLKREIERLRYVAHTPTSEVAIPDNYIDSKSAQIAVLTVERDIWKDVATKFLEK